MLFSTLRPEERVQGDPRRPWGLPHEPTSSIDRVARSCVLLTLVCALAGSAGAQLVQQGGKLVGAGEVGSGGLGCSAAVSSDGSTAIVGGCDDNSGVGAAWVFTRSGGAWTQQGGKLVGNGAVGKSHQGFSVALSADGNTAIVGGDFDNSDAGAAWVFTRSGGVWTQQGSKLVGTGAAGSAWQGYAVALSSDGGTAIVGGPVDSNYVGGAWVFARSGGVWTQQGSKLVGTDVLTDAKQGGSVALSADGNTAIVGGLQDNGAFGAAWVYTRSGGVWTQQGGKLLGTGAVGNAEQGQSVALSGDGNTAIVGGPYDNPAGAAWVFTRSGGVWTQQGSKLVGAGAVGFAQQGISVALSADGNTAIVGGYQDNSLTGAAWVFTRSGGVWTQQGGKLAGTGAVGNAGLGASVALSADGNTAIVGGPGDSGGLGAAWVFVNQPNSMGTPPTLTDVVNAASFQSGAVAPGEIITIFGSGIGPAPGTPWQFANGVALTALAQTQVLFDGTPAPLIYVSATQINAIVPYEVAGSSTASAQVSYQGTTTNSVSLNVAATAPALFTADGSGSHGGAILNQDNTLNSAANPAAAGSVVQIFATGEGVTKPASMDGKLQSGSTLPGPVVAVSVTIGGKPATVVYAGTAPGGVAGFLQVNAVVPSGLPSGSVPIVLTIGNASSQAGVTVAVH